MIETYRFGHVEIDGRTYTDDVIIYPDRVDANWWRDEGHRLSVHDLRDVLAERPDALVVGTGAQGAMQVPDDVRRHVEDAGIELTAAPTDEACSVYNRLASEKKTVAALHLTC
jgi:hypothetical protein